MTSLFVTLVVLGTSAAVALADPQEVVPVVVGQAVSGRTQYHAQTGAGEYIYGYAEPNAVKEERKLPDGTVLGSYSYASPDGSLVTNNYVADEHGFRSNLAPTLPKDNFYAAHGLVDVPAAPTGAVQGVVHHHQPQHSHQETVAISVPVASPLHHPVAVPVALQQHQIVDVPPQVHIEEKTFQASQPLVHHEVRNYQHGPHQGQVSSVETQTYSDAHPAVVHQQVKTVVDPKPVVHIQTRGVPIDQHGHLAAYAAATPAPDALVGVHVSSTPAVAYERVVVTPTPHSLIQEEHYYKPEVVHKEKSFHHGVHGHRHGVVVEKTYAEPGISVKKTSVDQLPTTIIEKTYHEDVHNHGQVVRTTVVDPKPVVTVEKTVHPLSVPVPNVVHHKIPVVKVHKTAYADPHYEEVPVVAVKHGSAHHHGIPLIEAYAAPAQVLETSPGVVREHVHAVQVHEEVPVYIPKAEPLYYGAAVKRVAARPITRPAYHYAPRYAKQYSYAKKGGRHHYSHRTPSSSVHVSVHHGGGKGYSYGHGHGYGGRRHQYYSPQRRSHSSSSRRHYYVGRG